MKKIYVLDTSVLINDPMAFKSFHNNDVIIPITVLDELDKLKKHSGEVGRNARVAIKLLDQVCATAGDISVGVLLENDVMFRVDSTLYDSKSESLYGDTRIISCAVNTQKENLSDIVVLVSDDINMRVRAKFQGISAEGYAKTDKSKLVDLYPDIQYVKDEEVGQELISNGFLDSELYKFNFYPNECVIFLDEEGNEIAKARQVNNKKIKLVKDKYPWGLSPRNKEQSFAIDFIMDPTIPLVSLLGIAGCGKTLLSIAGALELVLNEREYDKLLIFRPVTPVDDGIGYLKGDELEKLEPWTRPIKDNLEVLFKNSNGEKWRAMLDMYQRKEKIKFEALSFIRGRSIPDALILIDESQNISKEIMKTVLTRAGKNSKIILTGDISQIDDPHLDATNNGLTYAIDKFKGSELAAHVTFTKGERSRLASKAAEIL